MTCSRQLSLTFVLAEMNHDESKKKKKLDRKTYHRVRTSTRARCILTGLDELLESTFMLAEIISKKSRRQKNLPVSVARDFYTV